MLTIKVKDDCGNAPRKAFLRDFNIAFAKGDTTYVIDHVTDDVVWEMLGDRTIHGKANMQAALDEMKEASMDQMTLEKIITHGTDAAASGRFKMHGKEFAFCDMYKFAGFKGSMLKKISSFVIELT